ncbi:MAG: hypothetical protein GY952_14190 [Rhodobacteraceae bacterium]|nr:hypothetical protein [Paracoccaceae bacterium]
MTSDDNKTVVGLVSNIPLWTLAAGLLAAGGAWATLLAQNGELTRNLNKSAAHSASTEELVRKNAENILQLQFEKNELQKDVISLTKRLEYILRRQKQ